MNEKTPARGVVMVVLNGGEKQVLMQSPNGFAMQMTVPQTKKVIGALFAAVQEIEGPKKAIFDPKVYHGKA